MYVMLCMYVCMYVCMYTMYAFFARVGKVRKQAFKFRVLYFDSVLHQDSGDELQTSKMVGKVIDIQSVCSAGQENAGKA